MQDPQPPMHSICYIVCGIHILKEEEVLIELFDGTLDDDDDHEHVDDHVVQDLFLYDQQKRLLLFGLIH